MFFHVFLGLLMAAMSSHPGPTALGLVSRSGVRDGRALRPQCAAPGGAARLRGGGEGTAESPGRSKAER